MPDLATPAAVRRRCAHAGGGRCGVIPMLPQPVSDAPWYRAPPTRFVTRFAGSTGSPARAGQAAAHPLRPQRDRRGRPHLVLRHRADHRRRLRRRHRGRHHPVRARVRRRARAVGADRERRRPRQPRPHRAARRPRVRGLLDARRPVGEHLDGRVHARRFADRQGVHRAVAHVAARRLLRGRPAPAHLLLLPGRQRGRRAHRRHHAPATSPRRSAGGCRSSCGRSRRWCSCSWARR